MKNQRNHTQHPRSLILTLAGLIAAGTLLLCQASLTFAQTPAPGWSYTGDLNIARSDFTATLLPNGKVLVVGGYTPVPQTILNSAELYDPSTGTWSFTGSLNAPRLAHSATLLQNGKVLVAGGVYNISPPVGNFFAETTELYDPVTGAWSPTGNLNVVRLGHTATLLSNGKILIAGGGRSEIYDPATGKWSFTGNLTETRVLHTATLLQDGKVLAAGGCGDPECFSILGSAELYDPSTGAWSVTGGLNTPRDLHTATLLPNGNVLAAGGDDRSVLNGAELYNPATGRWSYTGSLNSGRVGHTATLLPNGQVLVAAGIGGDNAHGTNSAELYDLATGKWNTTASLNTYRYFHTATLLTNGRVLVVGDGRGLLRAAELYDSGLTPNAIDDAQFFVRQHYLDFLNREPDADGLAFWTNEIISCGGDAQCIEAKRINVSATYFLSIEFQQTGYLVYRMYKASYGNLPNAPVPIRLSESTPDTQQIGQGVIVNQTGWEQRLENNKQAFAAEFVQRSRFTSAYPTSLSPDQFVDTLFSNAGVITSASDRAAAISEFASAMTTNDAPARARALRRVAENSMLVQQEFNGAFVLMQYFGYLRRNPNDAPEATLDFQGYSFWLTKLNQFNGNFVQAEMVKAFLVSTEYRQRFGP